jgi:cellulose biosynthesis protein BcsQ
LKIIAISNIKGGIGKTSAAVNLIAALVASEASVVGIDLDPGQDSLTDYAPALGVPILQASAQELRETLAGLSAEFVIIDCGPGEQRRVEDFEAIFSAATHVLVPLQPEGNFIRATWKFLSTVYGTRKAKRKNLPLLLLVTHYRDALHPFLAAVECWGYPLAPVVVPYSARFSQAGTLRRSVVEMAPKSKESAAYRQLAALVRAW